MPKAEGARVSKQLTVRATPGNVTLKNRTYWECSSGLGCLLLCMKLGVQSRQTIATQTKRGTKSERSRSRGGRWFLMHLRTKTLDWFLDSELKNSSVYNLRADVFWQSLQTVNAKDRLLVLNLEEETKDWLVVDSYLYFPLLCLVLLRSGFLRNLASWLEF